MNRLTATKILIEDWMNEANFAYFIQKNNVEYTKGVETETGLKVLWVPKFKASFFGMIPEGKSINIIANLSLFYDNGKEETHITETNYKDYDSALFYDNRTGKYDVEPVNEII